MILKTRLHLGRSALQLLLDDPAIGAAKLRAVAAGLDLDLLDGILDECDRPRAGKGIPDIDPFQIVAGLVLTSAADEHRAILEDHTGSQGDDVIDAPDRQCGQIIGGIDADSIRGALVHQRPVGNDLDRLQCHGFTGRGQIRVPW